MSITEEKLAQIDRYLANEMKPGERDSFERQLSLDTELQGYVDFIAHSIPAIEELATHELKTKLQEKEKNISKIKKQLFLLKIAVMFFLVVSAGFLYMFFFSVAKVDMYAQHYAPYDKIVLSNISLYDHPAFGFYQSKNYNEAIDALLKLPDSPEKSFYLAQSYMARKDFYVALKYFDQSLEDPVFSGLSQWYKSLCYLKTQDQLKLKQQLKSIIINQNQFSDSASEILKKID